MLQLTTRSMTRVQHVGREPSNRGTVANFTCVAGPGETELPSTVSWCFSEEPFPILMRTLIALEQ